MNQNFGLAITIPDWVPFTNYRAVLKAVESAVKRELNVPILTPQAQRLSHRVLHTIERVQQEFCRIGAASTAITVFAGSLMTIHEIGKRGFAVVGVATFREQVTDEQCAAATLMLEDSSSLLLRSQVHPKYTAQLVSVPSPLPDYATSLQWSALILTE